MVNDEDVLRGVADGQQTLAHRRTCVTPQTHRAMMTAVLSCSSVCRKRERGHVHRTQCPSRGVAVRVEWAMLI